MCLTNQTIAKIPAGTPTSHAIKYFMSTSFIVLFEGLKQFFLKIIDNISIYHTFCSDKIFKMIPL